MLKALSIRQPWAWLIANGFKDVENRTRPTSFRGQFLIHAASRCTTKEWETAWLFVAHRSMTLGCTSADKAIATFDREVSDPENVECGGIIGIAEIADCIQRDQADSHWFTGPWGWSICNARPLPFTPCKGRLGFFTPDPSIEIKGL